MHNLTRENGSSKEQKIMDDAMDLVTAKLWRKTVRAIKILAATEGKSMVQFLDDLIAEYEQSQSRAA